MRTTALLALSLTSLSLACGDKTDAAAERSENTENADNDAGSGEDGAGDGEQSEGADGGGAGTEDGADGGTEDGAGADGTDGGDPPEAGPVNLRTEDGIALVADFAPAAASGPAVVLLHMIPPSWDRTSWPASFIEDLNDQGWTVLNVDRRGAGESGGSARDAYTGELGKWDAAAAVGWLESEGYGPVGIIGASNGSTTALDYAVYAAATDGALSPSWLAFLTGGTYTEAQNSVEQAASVPVLFAYSTAERDWSVAQQPHDTGAWVFHEYAAGDHGTKLFATSHAEELTGHLLAFGAEGFAR